MKLINKITSIYILLGIITYTSCKKNDDNLSSNKETIIVQDIDGNIYKTVTIGNQIWMAENLKVTKYNDGKEISKITNEIEWISSTQEALCDFNNNVNNSDSCGKLYNWYTVNTNILCPKGWHVPSNTDWTILKSYLNTDNDSLYTGTEAQSLASTRNWLFSDIDGSTGYELLNNNSTGFTGLPYGFRQPNGIFIGMGDSGAWWSSTEGNELGAGSMGMYYNLTILNVNDYYPKNGGLSVRCLKNDK